MMVMAYLAAVVAANLIVTAFGPGVSVLTAFLFIGLNITARDGLHDRWAGDSLKWRMGALIAAGGLISWLLNRDAASIAVASSVAFAVSETADAGVYHFLRDRPWYQRVNGSNTVSAGIDSVLFPILAFGGFLPVITLGQFAAKVFGGSLWALALRPRVLTVAALFALAAPLSGQSVSVGVGEFHNEYVTQEVVEAVVLVPLGAVTPNVIASWDLHGDGKPVVLPQVGRDLYVSFPVIVGADIGASAGPWDDYKAWEPHGSLRAIAFLPHGFKVVSIASWQPWNEWARSVVFKVDWTVARLDR